MASDTVQTITATLRVIAEQAERESDRRWLLEMADAVDGPLDDVCCPLCQETTCDEGCPLRAVRAIAMQKPTGARVEVSADSSTIRAFNSDGRPVG